MHNNPFFHGVDGFGDIYEHGEDVKIFRRLQKEHAVTALYDFASKVSYEYILDILETLHE